MGESCAKILVGGFRRGKYFPFKLELHSVTKKTTTTQNNQFKLFSQEGNREKHPEIILPLLSVCTRIDMSAYYSA